MRFEPRAGGDAVRPNANSQLAGMTTAAEHRRGCKRLDQTCGGRKARRDGRYGPIHRRNCTPIRRVALANDRERHTAIEQPLQAEERHHPKTSPDERDRHGRFEKQKPSCHVMRCTQYSAHPRYNRARRGLND